MLGITPGQRQSWFLLGQQRCFLLGERQSWSYVASLFTAAGHSISIGGTGLFFDFHFIYPLDHYTHAATACYGEAS